MFGRGFESLQLHRNNRYSIHLQNYIYDIFEGVADKGASLMI